ncbi:MAG: response regulator transcription factor [Ruminococcaceae bacterium]|nr:response regulator transcription factor [Oscillospiraceae bacterium]
MSYRDRILIVEDEKNIAGFMTTILTSNGYEVLHAETGAEALMLVSSHCPDAMILDLGLPDMDGQRIIRTVREWSQLPILVVSARSHERDKVSALDLGADDYVTKPFGTGELLARLRTALRHAHNRDAEESLIQRGKFTAGDLCVDFDKRRVYVRGEDAKLTQNEYRIVALLAKYAGRVLTYDYLISQIWGPNASGDNRILRVNMANIRRKIEPKPGQSQYIFTEMGVGYRMIEDD